MASKIQWLDWPNRIAETWNPWIGCTPCSPGCANCWGKREEDGRFRHLKRCLYLNPSAEHPLKTAGKEYFWNGPTYQGDKVLEQPLHWRDPRVVFVGARTDIFHEELSFEEIDKLFAVMALCPQHQFLVLTKRADRMAEYLTMSNRTVRVQRWFQDVVGYRRNLEVIRRGPLRLPLPNVGLGVSVCNQAEADAKIPKLLACPAAMRFVSIEPMLERVRLRHPAARGRGYRGWDWINGFGWVIVGLESGKGRRECKPEWVRSVVEQCRAASVPCFTKQLHVGGKVSHDPADWPADLRVRELPAIATKGD